MQNSQLSSDVALPPPLPADLYMPATELVACSICLRAQHAGGWIEAEHAIRELRTYDLARSRYLQASRDLERRYELESEQGAVAA